MRRSLRRVGSGDGELEREGGLGADEGSGEMEEEVQGHNWVIK